VVQIMYIHVNKCKNDTCWNCSRNHGKGGWKRATEGANSSMIYLIHCKKLCKYSNVPPASTTIIKNNRKKIKSFVIWQKDLISAID
jgi:hypothetical protein